MDKGCDGEENFALAQCLSTNLLMRDRVGSRFAIISKDAMGVDRWHGYAQRRNLFLMEFMEDVSVLW